MQEGSKILRRLSIGATAIVVPFCAAMAGAQSLPAVNTLTVTNNSNAGPGSLRQALADANDGDTIDFSLATPATITLTSGQLVVNKSLTITGPGMNQLTVSGNFGFRIFRVVQGTVIISDLTVTGGGTPINEDYGGGILNEHATLTVSNCRIAGNHALNGGGIFNNLTFGGPEKATLKVLNSVISGNSGNNAGGGIYAYANSEVEIVNSTISGNVANIWAGGGIFNGITVALPLLMGC